MNNGIVDVAIVGAGSAGAAVALHCARLGLRVLCIEKGALEVAGARWVNGVPGWAFDEAGIERPKAPELRGANVPAHIVAGWGPEKVTVQTHEALEVDMRHLVARLQSLASEAGATLRGETRAVSWSGDTLQTSAGPVRARWVVDASGWKGARLLGLSRVEPEHLCVAAQEVSSIRDTTAARSFFDRYWVPWGETLTFVGTDGGFSTVSLRAEGDEISLLAGSIPHLGHLAGPGMLDRLRREQVWIGDRLWGGSGTIPLRSPYEGFVSDRAAAVGDAANQVFPAHGSGVAMGLVAARLLAESLARDELESYAMPWQRRYGVLCAAYDVFRRFSQTSSADDIARMMRAGLLSPETAADSFAQRLPRISLDRLSGSIISARMAPVLARMGLVQALYRAYPKRPTLLRRWRELVAKILGET